MGGSIQTGQLSRVDWEGWHWADRFRRRGLDDAWGTDWVRALLPGFAFGSQKTGDVPHSAPMEMTNRQLSDTTSAGSTRETIVLIATRFQSR
jgi:hypothetical protein